MDPFLIFTLILAALIFCGTAAAIEGVYRANDPKACPGTGIALASTFALVVLTLVHFLPMP